MSLPDEGISSAARPWEGEAPAEPHAPHRDAEPVLVGWSGGKDSSLALQAALRDSSIRVHALITTVTDTFDRISMHGVRVALLEQQADALGFALQQIRIPPECPNDVYEEKMETALRAYYEQGVRRCIFGDLFLEDIREYRDNNLAKIDMKAIYPIWGLDTAQLARDFVDQGFRAVLVCVDPSKLDPAFCGRTFDHAMLDELPGDVDPCGENGEFHTFVHDGPIFNNPVPIQKGEVVSRDNFYFCDFLPAP